MRLKKFTSLTSPVLDRNGRRLGLTGPGMEWLAGVFAQVDVRVYCRGLNVPDHGQYVQFFPVPRFRDDILFHIVIPDIPEIVDVLYKERRDVKQPDVFGTLTGVPVPKGE